MPSLSGPPARHTAWRCAVISLGVLVLAEWMTTTGPELTETETEPAATVDETIGTDGPIDDTGSDAPPGEGFPWWAAIAVLVVLGGGAALVRSMKS